MKLFWKQQQQQQQQKNNNKKTPKKTKKKTATTTKKTTTKKQLLLNGFRPMYTNTFDTILHVQSVLRWENNGMPKMNTHDFSSL